jgi:DMSO/TMAO reductase YedYZ molybdopterin-dependent catalytic subunit
VSTDVVDDGPARVGEEPAYGAPVGLWRALERLRPPGQLFRGSLWRSPLRGTWLTSVFASVLLVGLPIVIVTGLLSYIAYQPQFAGNAFPSTTHGLHLPLFTWPTHPAWLYRLNEGLHVSLGLALIPVVLAKLWSVMPKLFSWPPARSLAQVLERLSLALLVGSILFELSTGVLNTQYDYSDLGFDFYTAHYYGAWVFIASFVLHVGLKFPTMCRSLRSRRLRSELRTPLADTVPEPPDVHGLVAQEPSAPTLSRRGLLGLVGGASLAVTAVTIGETIGPRSTALLSPRGRSYGSGPTDFQVNRTARSAQVTPRDTGPGWRLTVVGASTVSLSRDQLLAMPQHTASLPIACVEGWSTVQTWSGVRLRELARLAGTPDPQHALVHSLEKAGVFARAVLNGGQLTDGDSLLALKVNGADLSADHGYPARVIVPALPGVHNTKWVARIELDGPLT